MKDAGCRLLVVGFESGDPQILRQIKKGATIEQALGLHEKLQAPGDSGPWRFPGGPSGRNSGDDRKVDPLAVALDPETIQVSISHPFPGTRFFEELREKGFLTEATMADEKGHQLPNIRYPGSERGGYRQGGGEILFPLLFPPEDHLSHPAPGIVRQGRAAAPAAGGQGVFWLPLGAQRVIS